MIYYQEPHATLYQGDAKEVLEYLSPESVDMCVTSPPYYGLREYGTASWEGGNPECDHLAGVRFSAASSIPDATRATTVIENIGKGTPFKDICGKCGAVRKDLQVGLESTPEEYVSKLVSIFREVRRVLKKEGTLWLNLGDSYAGSWGDYVAPSSTKHEGQSDNRWRRPGYEDTDFHSRPPTSNLNGLKKKDLIGIPWSVAKALQSPYYTGQITREIDRVWLAAMIDTEGTICGYTHERKDNGDIRNGIHVNITNSNIALLDRCFAIWPTTKEEHNPHSDGHLGDLPTWRWIVHSMEEKSQLLKELYPYFVGKKKQALLAWNFLEISQTTRGRNKGDIGLANREKYQWIVDSLSRLNHLEPVDIPTWCKEPPSMYKDGYYLRQDIIWSKPNPMPESVTDRCTKSHEYLFLLSKSAKYYYDQQAILEPITESTIGRGPVDFGGAKGRNYKEGIDASDPNYRAGSEQWGRTYDYQKSSRKMNGDNTKIGGNGTGFQGHSGNYDADGNYLGNPLGRNRRSVWTITTQPYKKAHFATYPPALVEPCILAGCPKNGVALDPFAGSGTTIAVAKTLNRKSIGIELNPDYCKLCVERLQEIPIPMELGV